ncbi:flagellar hook assembly protein FlgD [Achromobacter sp. GG226]|uniref:flagellar hook capping FlgD N-terminal domain-containing protein n=1 Tax=Verticiella alkaliphila TaxID=2779529 RepID=UPI001C0C4691|nr:flagellar hook capping FlgD N-terminal domain-containing protein [Verticiella sp. GG226]MBU4610504.1 flagellar hook assembly protein FlgD [Verticiella sp. GG226]
MTTVNTSNSLTGALGAAAGSSNSFAAETEDRFLTLLVTQLKNQDPLNPMENAELTSQLAQLSTVNGITQLNNTLLALSGQMDISQSLQATSLIGKEVLVPGDKIAVGNGVVTPLGVDVVSPAANVTVSIVDGAGVPVRKIDLGAQPVGVTSVPWDGKNDLGEVVPDGAYRLVVAAKDAEGASLTAGALTWGKVNSVAYGADGMKMDLGLAGSFGLFDIRKVL